MHEDHPIEKELMLEAEKLSKRYKGAPVAIIIGESKEANIDKTMVGSTMHDGFRLRDLLGMLETAKQQETWKHFQEDDDK